MSYHENTASAKKVNKKSHRSFSKVSLDASDVKNTSMQNALSNKLNAVLANIAAGNYQSALNQLQHDILPKTDGCVTNGTPDQNDWIITCPEQEQVYSAVMQLIELLESML